MTLWRYGTREKVASQFETSVVEHERLVEVREQYHATHRWVLGRHEQSVVAPRMRHAYSRRRPTTETIAL